ncbi:hypothetical protein V2J09_003747 [Rumex salicifolius]
MAFNLGSCSVIVPKIPAKTLTFELPNLRIPCYHLPSPSSATSICFRRPSPQSRATQSQSQRFVYPDPIPDFADAETEKFKVELKTKLIEARDTFGEELDSVVSICAKILAEFLHKEYGGPGTLMVEPFTYMFVALNENKLPGASFAARASLLWAQNNVDHDWEAWNA